MTPSLPTPTLQPIYCNGVPDEPLPLYAGPVRVTQGPTVGEGDGAVEMSWAPSPRVRFEIPSVRPPVPLQVQGCDLRLMNTGAEGTAHILSVTHSGGAAGHGVSVRGRVLRSMVHQTRLQAASMYFHVVNFWHYLTPRPDPAPPEYDVGRVELNGGGWRVALQAVSGLRDLTNALDADSGRAICRAKIT